MMLSITPGTPTHSKITGYFGVAPSVSPSRHMCHQPTGSRSSFSLVSTASSSAAGMSFRCPRRSTAVNGELTAGSITTSAPHAVASARRPGE